MKNTTPVSPGSTIYDVADLAQVSISTVSRFLNNPAVVKPETGTKIQAAMDQLAYIPHGNTGTRAKRRVGRIGVLTPFFPAPSFVQRLQGMTPVFRKNHCEMVIYPVDGVDQLGDYLHSIPFSKRLDGLIILSMRIGEDDAQRLAGAGIEVVLVEYSHPMFSSVEADNIEGGALAARVFLNKGFHPCAFIGEKAEPPYSLLPSELRWQGYRGEFDKVGLVVDPLHFRRGGGTTAEGYRMAREILSGPTRPRAVFAMSDLQAFGVLKAARELGLRVPQDLAVLGFDDIEASELMELSTVSQALNESGRQAAELLVGRIRDPGRPPQRVQLPVTVVERSTT